MNVDYIAALDIDECEASPCGQYAVCTNGPLLGKVSDPVTGPYKCECEDGYEGDPYTGCLLSTSAYTTAVTGSIYVPLQKKRIEELRCSVSLPML